MAPLRIQAVLLAAIVAAIAIPGVASAQCRLCDTPTTTRDETKPDDQIRLEIETSLNFDRLILFGEGAGSAVIRPDGSSAAQGAVADVGSRAMVGTANVHGEPGRA